jgi:hypothetical protein
MNSSQTRLLEKALELLQEHIGKDVEILKNIVI